MPRTIDQQLVADVRVVVRLGGRRMAAAEFDEHVREAATALEGHRASLVVVVGGGPARFDAAERAKLQRFGLLTRKHAILTPGPNPFVQTALRWLRANVRVFPPHRFEDACDFLEIEPALRPAVLGAVEAMKKRIAAA